MQTNQFINGHEGSDYNKTDIKGYLESLKYPVPFYGVELFMELFKIDKVEEIGEDLDFLIKTESREGNTSSEITLYGYTSKSEAFTSTAPETYQMYEEFREILLNYSTEEVEDESSPFIIATKEWIEKYGIETIKLIKICINSSYPTTYLLSEVLEMLGDIRNQASYEERRILLEDNTKSNIPEIRYGAILGLANMNSQESIGVLEEALSNEQVQMISNTIKDALGFLKK